MSKSLSDRVAELCPAARGTVSEVRKPCTRPGCKACASGRKHPSFIYVYSDETGRRRCLHVPRDLVPELRRRLANGRLIDRLLFESGAQFVRTRGGRRG
ncbi:MAG: hypothetical protein KAI66_25415 [Lentisphaeria bacterium]|nr:hypothetical protein [Lentisphaeria bacterium]